MNSRRACRPCMGSCSPIPGRGCFGDLPGDGIVVSPPPQSLKRSLCHFDVNQAFVQSDLEEDVYLRLPKGCGDLSGKVVRLNKRLYGLKQASRTWHAHLTTCLKRLGFEQCMTDLYVFGLIEDGRVAITAVVHVDDIFAVGQKERCDRLCVDLNRTIPVKTLSYLKWYGGCRYSRDRKKRVL